VASVILAALTILTVAAGSVLVGLYAGIVSELPVLDARIHSERAEAIRIYDAGRPPVLLTEIAGRYTSEPLQVADLPDSLLNATLATVDEDFLARGSLDLGTLARTLGAEIRGTAADTASPITLGFIRQAYVSGHAHPRPQLYETALAFRLEQAWSKKRIVTEYLNTIYFGDGAYGVTAAAQSYYGKDATSLTTAESALLVAVAVADSPLAPRAQPEASQQARDTILNRMFQLNLLDGPTLQQALAEPLEFSTRPQQTVSRCPAWADLIEQQLVKRYGAARVLRGGLAVYTTLQLSLQEMAEAAISDELVRAGDPIGALLAVDVASGVIVAMAQTHSGEIPDVFSTPHEARDLYRPIALAAAFAHGVSPFAAYEGQGGPVILADAAIQGDTVVYPKLTQQLGWDVILNTVARFTAGNSSSSQQPSSDGTTSPPALTVLDGAALYVPLAAEGRRPSSSLTSSLPGTTHLPTIVRVESFDGTFVDQAVTSWDQVLDEQSAFLVTQILMQGVSATTAPPGLDGELAGQGSVRDPMTGSTDTAWFVAYADGLLAVAWVGFPDGRPVVDANQEDRGRLEALPAQICVGFMTRALVGREARAGEPPKTAHWRQVVVCSTSGDLASPACTRTRKLLVPDSLAPSDTCRLHVQRPAASTTTTHTVTTLPMVTVPSLIGLTPAEAEAQLADLGLVLSTTIGAPGEQPGRIATQNPASGASLKRGQTVTVVVQALPATSTTAPASTTTTATTAPPAGATSTTVKH
jgi:penicillin-binding protein 1A